MLLPGLEQTEMRVGFGIGGMCLEVFAPGLFALGNFALLLECEGGLPEID